MTLIDRHSGSNGASRLLGSLPRLALLISVITVTVPSYADLEAGNAAFDRGDYVTALRELEPVAELGNAGAQTKVGYMYQFGKGTRVNLEKALNWNIKAASQDQSSALNNLCIMYYYGNGVRVDRSRAFELCLKAGRLGSTACKSFLGLMIEDGVKDIAPDRELAYALLEVHGLPETKRRSIALRRSFDPDQKRGAEFDALIKRLREAPQFDSELMQIIQERNEEIGRIIKAANNGDANAQFRLALAYRDRDRVRTNDPALPPDTVAQAWWRRASAQGHAQAQYMLAKDLLRQARSSSGKQEAVPGLCKESIDLLNRIGGLLPEAQRDLADVYVTNDCGPAQPAEARKLYEKVWATKHDLQTADRLANLYSDATNGFGNLNQSLQWSRMVLKLQPPDAAFDTTQFEFSYLKIVWDQVEKVLADPSFDVSKTAQMMFNQMLRGRTSMLRASVREIMESDTGYAIGLEFARDELGIAIRSDFQAQIVLRKWEDHKARTVYSATISTKGPVKVSASPQEESLADFNLRRASDVLPQFPRRIEKRS
jgi:TPR repeat protein